MFDLKFLGKGAAFFPQFGNTNAYFAKGSDIFFIDFGESAFEKAVRLVKPYDYERTFVLLTHLHADHSGSLASLISYMYFMKGKKVTVIHPETTVVDMLRLQGISEEYYNYSSELPSDLGIKLEFIRVNHSDIINAYGLLLSDSDETIYYSGDSASLPEKILESFMKNDISRLYHDASSHESKAHCYYIDLAEIIPPDKRDKVYCMHYDGDYMAELIGLGFSVVESI